MSGRRARQAVSYVVLILIALVGLAPLVYLLLLSFKSRIEVLQVPPSLDFDWETVKENYDTVINDLKFPTYILNSVIVTFSSTIIALVLGAPAAYAFSRLHFRGRETWASTILSFRFMPPIAVAIPIFLMIRWLGLPDSLAGLILPYVAFSLPLVVWIMIGFFDEIPRDIDDAALVDGCTRPMVLVRVLLPLARPGMAVASIFIQRWIVRGITAGAIK
jgi:multiple sugar transport system permease protein